MEQSSAGEQTRQTSLTWLLIAACLLSVGTLVVAVSAGMGTLPFLLLYLTSIITAIGAVYQVTSEQRTKVSRPAMSGIDVPLIGIVLLLQLAGLLYFSSFPRHYVQDEFLTGYASYTLPPLTEIHWFAGYPREGDFVAQFPILYFILQKPFLAVLGPSLEAIRISTWPYHLLTVGLVYLLGKEIFSHRLWAVASAVVYIALAPNLYMAGWGTHNISSTAFFLASAYFAVLMVRRNSREFAVACGIFATLGYLTYTSSYLTVPLLLLLVGMLAYRFRSWRPLELFWIVLVVVFVGLVPFVTYALTQDNYFMDRSEDVNVIQAFWGQETDREPFALLWDHVVRNVQSLYTPGIGGVTDFWFGKQALFNPLTLTLLVIGMGVALVSGIVRRRALDLFIVAVVLVTFVFGMLLTLPAGGFHRVTMAFPFVAFLIVMAVRFLTGVIARLAWREGRGALPSISSSRFRSVIAVLFIALFALLNVQTAVTMVKESEDVSTLLDSLPIVTYIEENVPPGSRILISAFPGYHLEREIVIRTGDEYDAEIVGFDTLLDSENSVMILLKPSHERIARLSEAHPGGRLIDTVHGTELERHRIFVPEGATAGSLARETTR